MSKADELRAELKRLEKQEAEEKAAKIAAVKRQWRFTITPAPDRWDPLYDDTLVWYYLQGEVLNADELKAVGAPADSYANGGMKYLYNVGTGKIAMRGSGGTIYIRDSWSICKNATVEQVRTEMLRTFGELADFISQHPEGGDVTGIVTGNKYFNW